MSTTRAAGVALTLLLAAPAVADDAVDFAAAVIVCQRTASAYPGCDAVLARFNAGTQAVDPSQKTAIDAAAAARTAQATRDRALVDAVSKAAPR